MDFRFCYFMEQLPRRLDDNENQAGDQIETEGQINDLHDHVQDITDEDIDFRRRITTVSAGEIADLAKLTGEPKENLLQFRDDELEWITGTTPNRRLRLRPPTHRET